MAQRVRFAYRRLAGQGDDSDPAGAVATLLTEPGAAAAAIEGWVAEGAPPARCCGLIDLRPAAAFAAQHLDGSTSLPWGADGADFVARAHELPQRGSPVALLADCADTAAAASDHLRRAGYAVRFAVALPAAALTASGAAAAGGDQASV